MGGLPKGQRGKVCTAVLEALIGVGPGHALSQSTLKPTLLLEKSKLRRLSNVDVPRAPGAAKGEPRGM